MVIRFGYVAISKVINITSSHSITYSSYVKDVNNDRLYDVVLKNLDSLIEILNYNISNNIHFYRMSSAIFPLATHPNVNFDVLNVFRDKLIFIGKIINDSNMRVDIHLDQFCVLNSVSSSVVTSSINIINFYKNMFDVMGIDSKMVIHVGSSVGGKEEGLKRFIANFYLLEYDVRKCLIIENDDKVYNVLDVLFLCKRLGCPMVLDYHHHICNHVSLDIDFNSIFSTWNGDIPKVHFSSPKNSRDFRAHNDYISIIDFIDFLSMVKNYDFDVMIEAKEKDFALFKLVRELRYRGFIFLDDTTLTL